MSDSHGSNQLSKALLVEDVPDHTVGLALEEPSLRSASNDSTGVLSGKGTATRECWNLAAMSRE